MPVPQGAFLLTPPTSSIIINTSSHILRPSFSHCSRVIQQRLLHNILKHQPAILIQAGQVLIPICYSDLGQKVAAIPIEEEARLHQAQPRLHVLVDLPRLLRRRDDLFRGFEVRDAVLDALQLLERGDDVVLRGGQAVQRYHFVRGRGRREQDLRDARGGPRERGP